MKVPWFPKSIHDLAQSNLSLNREVGRELMQLPIILDHPSSTDKEYKKRQAYITSVSLSHKIGQDIPTIGYTQTENETWVKIYRRLKESHVGVMSKRYMANLEKVEKALGYQHRIPELRDVDSYLQAETGFRLKAVNGILNQRDFLNYLGHRVFACTQYIRHHDCPEYTPEPDIVHELVGHIPMFADREFADISHQIGILSCGVESSQITRLGSIYWYTVEYGSHLEDGKPRGYGAGIASSIGECENYHGSKFEKFDPFIHADRKYPIQTFQPVYMYCESFDQSLQSLIKFGESLEKPFKVQYDFRTNEIKTDRDIKCVKDYD